MTDAIRIEDNDNVAVLKAARNGGETIQVGKYEVILAERIAAGHKVALHEIPKGGEVIRYGFPIGRASEKIAAGAWVHTHNLKTELKGPEAITYNPASGTASCREEGEFLGFRRSDGKIGIRNEIWIINTTGCVNATSRRLAYAAGKKYQGQVDGIYAFEHPHGCSQLGEDFALTKRMLAGLVHHPNAAGVLLLSLGCENNNLGEFSRVLGEYDKERVKTLILQEERDEIASGLHLIGELIEYARGFARQPVSLSGLTVGLTCGASDGFSGLTANPLVGDISDRIIDAGGAAVLTEVPEMFGAEESLLSRCADREVFERAIELINSYKNYYLEHGHAIHENPAPGNKAGGITTLEEKSLGCVQKGGTRAITDVIACGERVEKKGLNILGGPGNDLVAQTALTASGAQLILFTTGRGNPLGAPVPTVKISTNSELAEHKPHWIDFDAGRLLRGCSREELASELFELVVDTASGCYLTHNEKMDDREIALFKKGIIL